MEPCSPSSPSPERNRDQGCNYSDKLCIRGNSHISSSYKNTRPREVRKESTYKKERTVRLSDKDYDSHNHSYAKNSFHATSSYYHTPHEPIDCYSGYNPMDLYDRFSDNVTKNIDLTKNESMKEKEEEYCSLMEEAHDQTIGIPVKKPKGNDTLFSFRNKPTFPSKIIPVAEKFDQDNFDLESVDELIGIETREFNFSKDIYHDRSCSKYSAQSHEHNQPREEHPASQLKVNEARYSEIPRSFSLHKDIEDAQGIELAPCKKDYPSSTFNNCMNNKIYDYKQIGPTNLIENTNQKDPFSMIHENSKDGSVIFNHTFNNGNNHTKTDSQVSNVGWLYKTAPKYKAAIVDYDKSSSQQNSPQNQDSFNLKVIEKDPAQQRKIEIDMIVRNPIVEKSNEQSSTNEHILHLHKMKSLSDKESSSRVKIEEKENIKKDDIAQSIKSLHSRIDSIHTVLSSNNPPKDEEKSQEKPIHFHRDSSEFKIKSQSNCEVKKSERNSEERNPVNDSYNQFERARIIEFLKSEQELENNYGPIHGRLTPKLPSANLAIQSERSDSLRETEKSVEMAAMFPPFKNSDMLLRKYASNRPPTREPKVKTKRSRSRSSKTRKNRSKYKVYERQMKWLKEKNKKNDFMRRQQYKSNKIATKRSKSPKNQTRHSTSLCRSERSSKGKKTIKDKTFCDFLQRNEIWQENKKKRIEETTIRLQNAEKQLMKTPKTKRRSRSDRKQHINPHNIPSITKSIISSQNFYNEILRTNRLENLPYKNRFY
ncbi:unnamed protein product [Moneuplotes crassus]|uniref:Uncharacterized protein n=1 Tax=Euplotes crassus TaxID=5936 RepID=A0AAD2DA46_EUPCR|nr:unnamed protein product [Moneuplotes crassus]